MEKFALIVAGGSGSRMKAETPKQFLVLAGKPLLMRTMERFAHFDPLIRLVLVLPGVYMDYWDELCSKYRFHLPHVRVEGGPTRFQSVRNGLSALPDEGLVFIHDGVRPLVSFQTIRNCEQTAMNVGNAIPAMPVTESLRKTTETGTQHVERGGFYLVQTPQTFLISIIKKAYLLPEQPEFTDDASVCEAIGERIRMVEGNPENIKITRPIDLTLAGCLLRNESFPR